MGIDYIFREGLIAGEVKEERTSVDSKRSPTSTKGKPTFPQEEHSSRGTLPLHILDQGSALADGTSKSSPQNNLRDPLFAFNTGN